MDITRQLRGKRVAMVLANGNLLEIKCHDGTALTIAWLDDDGQRVKGRPVVAHLGKIIRCEGLHEIAAAGRAG